MPYYHIMPDGSKTRIFVRHPDNRIQHSVRRRYVSGIFADGVTKDARAGRTVSVPNCLDPNKWILATLAGFTLLDAVYEAEDQQPDNEQVKLTVKMGVRDLVLLHPNIPGWARAYVRDQGNDQCGEGSATNFMQHYLVVDVANVRMLAWRKAQKSAPDSSTVASGSASASGDESAMSGR